MKSSTIRRSALSKESMDVIENLSNEAPTDNKDNSQSENYTPGEYQRENNSEQDADNRSKEIDLLWQTFKSPQFTTNSTFVHVFGGFILGVLVSAAALALFIMFALNSDNPSKYDISTMFKNNVQSESVKDNVESASALADSQESPIEEIETPSVTEETNEVSQNEEVKASKDKKNAKAEKKSKHSKADKAAEGTNKIQVKKYVIKDGDTVEGIIKHNYGAYTQARAEAIMKVNKLKDLDHIGIGQELLLPVEK